MMPDTIDRVPEQTSEEINQRIQQKIRENVAFYGGAREEMIEWRLEELDREWDIERILELNAATLATTATLLGLLGRKRWLLLSGAVTFFLAQHALQGWCPPLPLLRRWGFRTQYEIEQERYALKAIRGDFEGVHIDEPLSVEQVDAALEAVKR